MSWADFADGWDSQPAVNQSSAHVKAESARPVHVKTEPARTSHTATTAVAPVVSQPRVAERRRDSDGSDDSTSYMRYDHELRMYVDTRRQGSRGGWGGAQRMPKVAHRPTSPKHTVPEHHVCFECFISISHLRSRHCGRVAMPLLIVSRFVAFFRRTLKHKG
jgi:hypothetical protein